MARPITPAGYQPSTRADPGPVTSMPYIGRPSPAGCTPIRASARIAPGFSVSPHSFSRGNANRSKSRTRRPERAITIPATHPAGPPPTTMTSSIGRSRGLVPEGRATLAERRNSVPSIITSPDHHGAVLRPESEAVAQGGGRRRGTADPRQQIQLTVRIGFIEVDGGRQESIRERERRGDDSGRTAGALGVTDHRLRGRA